MRALPRVTVTPALRLAALCAAIALLLDIGLLARAARGRDAERIVPLRIAAASPVVPRAPDARGLIQSASARRPFDPLGAPPSATSSGAVIPQAMQLPASQPKLIGTVVGGAESFVVMALPDGAIKVVHLRERAGELRLRSVSAGGAVFDDIHGDRVTLRVPTPGSEPQP